MAFTEHRSNHFQVKNLVTFPGGSDGKESACSAGDLGLTLGWEDALEKGKATPSSILAWRIPWTEEPDGLQSVESQSRTRPSDQTTTVPSPDPSPELRPSLCGPADCSRQAPLSVGFPRPEYRRGLPCPPPGHLPGPGTEPCLSRLLR